jgi:hypothetical protein
MDQIHRGVSFSGGACRAGDATIRSEKPSNKCYLNGEDVRVPRFVRPCPVSYTECFAVSSNTE